jgi:dihydropyrimidinase
MADFDLVISNGTVVTAADVARCEVGIRDGRIVALADQLEGGRTTIDATDMLVMPGGIDSHCHVDQRAYGATECADDFLSGTISAACGGTTTIIPFAMALRGESLREVVDDYRRRAEGKAVIDYAIHLIVPDASADRLGQELPSLVREGYTSFKIFLSFEGLKLADGEVLRILETARRERALVMVHAENDDCVSWLTEKLVDAGQVAPQFHGAARPIAVEREAVHRAITLAELADVPILVVHVASADAMEQIAWARRRGRRVFAETCPQYLVLTADDMGRPHFEGAKFVCTPPPRDRATQEALWRGLGRGAFEVVSSDHSPYRFAGPTGKQAHGPNAPFHQIANGLPGIEMRLPLLFSEGVLKQRIDLNAFVALAATNAAKTYGIYPRKGTIAVGADADLAIWDPAREVEVRHELLHDGADYTPYEGMRVTGWPVVTISRGEVVWRDGEVTAEPGRGRFLPCDRLPPVVADA